MISRQKLTLVEEEVRDDDDIDVSEERGPCPDAPDYLSWEAKQVWLESAPDLWLKDRLHGGAISLLVNYCVAVGVAREMAAILEVDGKIIKGKPHPAYRMMLDAMGTARAVASELRFAREHLNSTDSARVNGWGDGLLA